MFNILIQYHPLIVCIARAYEAIGIKCKFFSTESIFDLISEFKPMIIIVLSNNTNRAFVKACCENPWIKVILIGTIENEFTHQLVNSGIKTGRILSLRPSADIVSFNGGIGQPHLKCKYLICESNTPQISQIIYDNKLNEAISIRMYGQGWSGYGACGITSDNMLKDLLVSSEIFITSRTELILNAILCISKVVHPNSLYNLSNIYKTCEEANQVGYNNIDIGEICSKHSSFHVASEILQSVDIDIRHKIPKIECKNV